MKTIKFKKEMIQAIKEGRKTQTRRVLKPQPQEIYDGMYCNPYNHNFEHFAFWTKDDGMLLFKGNIPNTAHWKPKYGLNEIIQIKNTDEKIKIVNIEVQRLQDISDSDCKKEGIEPLPFGKGWYDPTLPKGVVILGFFFNTPQEAFMRYWNYYYKKDLLWHNNPFVWVYEFERIH